MNEFTLAQVIAIKTEYNHTLVDRIYNEYNLHAMSKRSNDTFSELWIFKNNALRFIIDLLPDDRSLRQIMLY